MSAFSPMDGTTTKEAGPLEETSQRLGGLGRGTSSSVPPTGENADVISASPSSGPAFLSKSVK